MAWNRVYLDTFASYALTDAVTFGKWTTAAVLPSPVTIAEDGLQGASGGSMTRTITGAAGHILATRGSGTGAGDSEIFNIAGTSAQLIRLVYNGASSKVTLITPDAASHQSSQLVLTPATHHNYVLAYFYNGAAMVYDLYIDGTHITDIGSSIVTATVPTMSTLAIYNGGTIGLNQRSFIAAKAYSGSGGVYSAGDIYSGTGRRGVLYGNADGRWPASTGGRLWIPSTGSTYFERLNETLASTSEYISTTHDPNGSPGGAPNYLDRASWSYGDSPTNVTLVDHVQFSNLVQMQNGSATYSLYIKASDGTDTATAVTPLTAPAAWTWQLNSYDVDPRDSAAWSKAKLDSLEVGIEPLNFT